MTDSTVWVDDRDVVIAFGEILFEADVLDTARDVLDFMARPSKWAPEYDLWIAAGRPLPSNRHDAERFANFVAKLEALS